MISQLTCKDKVKSKPQDSIPSFIRKTYDILEERKFPDIIDWNPEGTALVIKKPSEFCQKVLPAYFKHNNLTSFVRQLNMYNFHKKRTQNIDHVYSHELFQRGQKHLLKEIKRKGQEHNLDKSSPKSPEQQFSESSQTPKDLPSLCYENQILKRLYNEAMTKINKLESQVTELSNQNQSLWSQICSGNQQNPALMARFEKSELTLDQLPMTFGDISIPPLKLSCEQAPLKKTTPTTINGFFSSAPEDSGESTDASHNSPSLHQPSMESEKCFDMTESTPVTISTESTYTLPPLSLTPLISQTPQVQPRDLFASRTEMSVGQIFEAWNNEFQQQNHQDSGILGKRHLDTENVSSGFQVPEPLMKRQESIGLFIKKGLMSNGAEDREFFRKMLGKNNSSTNEDCEFGMGIDLMGF